MKVITLANTNKLLGNGYIGVKTGITPNAGPCLATCFHSSDDKRIAVIVLNCETMDQRYVECDGLTQWVINNFALIKSVQVHQRNLSLVH
jgi:D-alanyl-D-alanine carboxypeptidase